ncbi:hypothetical protein [Halostella litorea]|nr:hypothetical protein [Halostella litorea]
MSHSTPEREGGDDESLADELERRVEDFSDEEVADAEDVKEAFLSS